MAPLHFTATLSSVPLIDGWGQSDPPRTTRDTGGRAKAIASSAPATPSRPPGWPQTGCPAAPRPPARSQGAWKLDPRPPWLSPASCGLRNPSRSGESVAPKSVWPPACLTEFRPDTKGFSRAALGAELIIGQSPVTDSSRRQKLHLPMSDATRRHQL